MPAGLSVFRYSIGTLMASFVATMLSALLQMKDSPGICLDISVLMLSKTVFLGARIALSAIPSIRHVSW